jgi:hypothetical protein
MVVAARCAARSLRRCRPSFTRRSASTGFVGRFLDLLGRGTGSERAFHE